MKSLLLSLILCTALAPPPSAAQDTSGLGDRGTSPLAFELDGDDAVWLLEKLVERWMAFVRDHVEIKKRYHEGPSGDDVSGEIQVKVYPEGKGQSDESLSGKGRFEFSRRPNDLRLRFDLDLSPGPNARRPEDYL